MDYADVVVMLWTRVLNMMVQIVTETLARYATVLQVIDEVEPWSVYDCFLPDSFRFVIHSSSFH
jgi:hypothetical protein